jgi:hypothetical protein
MDRLKLTSVWIKNFRSIFDEDFYLELTEGVNALGRSQQLRQVQRPQQARPASM